MKAKNLEVNSTALAISVLIPFRNEEKNLKNLIQSFESLNYNLHIVEFIFIDDNSTDNSYELVSEELKKTSLIYKLIKQPNHTLGKKKAIITGVENAKHEHIVTTDADSIPSKGWLSQFSNSFNEKNEFVFGPVINKPNNTFLGNLQSIEALLLAGTSVGGASNKTPIICSGANLGYSKALFNEINPYDSNLEIASGDDLFFLDKVILYQKKVSFLKSKKSLVYTESPNSYLQILSQAIRWSTKNKLLENKKNLYLSFLVFATNILLVANIITFSCGTTYSLVYLFTKFLIDLVFLIVTSWFYQQQQLIFFSPFIYFLYPIHLIIIFVSSFFISVKWKERKI